MDPSSRVIGGDRLMNSVSVDCDSVPWIAPVDREDCAVNFEVDALCDRKGTVYIYYENCLRLTALLKRE